MANFDKLSKAAQAAFLKMQGRIEQIEEEFGADSNDTAIDHAVLEIYAEYKAIADEAEGTLEAIKPYILTRMLERGEDSFKDEAATVRVQNGRKTVFVNPKKLIERGVSAEIVKYATEEKEGEPFAVITVNKKKEEN